jgi:hypothetical protein
MTLNALLSDNLHNYIIVGLFAAWIATLAIALYDPTRLEILKDVGMTLLGALGIVGGVHAGKEGMKIWKTPPAAPAPRVQE